MKEQTYLEEIRKMREAGLCRTSPASAKSYAAQLKAGTPLSLAASADGICPEGRGLLELDGGDALERLNCWQAERTLSDKERAALKLLLKIHQIDPLSKKAAARLRKQKEARNAKDVKEAKAAEQQTREPGATTLKQMYLREYAEGSREPELPVSLYGILSALRQATKNRREVVELPAYTLLMRALLLNDSFYWTSDLTVQELRPGGSHYTENMQTIAANLQDAGQRQKVKEGLREALWELEDQWDGPQMRVDIGRACGYLEKEMEVFAVPTGYEGSAMEALLHRMASMQKGISGYVYQSLSAEALTENLMDLVLLSIEAAQGIWTCGASWEERQGQLGERARLLLAALGSGLPVKAGVWKRKEWQPALLELLEKNLLIPARGGRTLQPAPDVQPEGIGSIWKAVKAGAPDGAAVWELLEELLRSWGAGDMPEPNEEKLCAELKSVLQQMQPEESRCAAPLRFLTSCCCAGLHGEDCKKAIGAAEWILQEMKRRPEMMENALQDALCISDRDREARLGRREGVSLFEAELAGQCAGRYLQLAMEEKHQEYWAACAVTRAGEARKAMETLGAADILILETSLTEALACCLEGSGAVSRSGKRDKTGQKGEEDFYSGEVVMEDFVVPAAAALRRAWDAWEVLSDSQKLQAEGLFRQVREGCAAQLFGQGSASGEGSALGDCLRKSGGWDRLSAHVALSKEDCVWICDYGRDCFESFVSCASSGSSGSSASPEAAKVMKASKIFTLLQQREQPASLFLPWYCNTFDSTLASGPACTQERTEASLLQILLSGQRVTLSLNQMADNEMIWNLTELPAFLWMLRRGLVTVSLFGGLDSLKAYAVTRMRNPGFVWSSLPADFEEVSLRERAACWLERSGTLYGLPEEHRALLVKMRDAIERMDENLREYWKIWYDQNQPGHMRMRGIRPAVGLTQRLKAYYSEEKPIADFAKMRQLNALLLSGGRIANRSDYRKAIWAIEGEKAETLAAMGLPPKLMEQKGLSAEELAACGSDMLENMIRISDECHNRMLGERISLYQYYVYDRETALLLPEWSGRHRQGPIHDGGCLLYRQLETDAGENTGMESAVSWDQAAEQIMELEDLAAKMPGAGAEQLCGRLLNQGLDAYGVFGAGNSLRLQKLAFQASTGKVVKRQMSEEGELYQEEKRGNAL